MKATLLAFLLLSATTAACSTPQIITVPRDPEKPGELTVTGTATVEVSPDCADLTMTVTSDMPRPGAAATDAQGKEQALVAALGKLGVAADDIKLSTLVMYPVYDQTPSSWGQTTIHAYRAEIVVTATTRKFEQIGPLMEAGATAGASAMRSEFRRSDLAQLKTAVRDQALAAARAKAAQTATGLGIVLGRIVSVAEQPGGQIWSNTYFTRNGASPGGGALGGMMEPLTLEVTIGYELAKAS